MRREQSGGRPFLLVVSLSAILAGVQILRHQPPAPRSAEVPASEFSAGRAREILRRLVGDGRPHPVGTAANARVRERVIAELDRLGYEPFVQEAFACGPTGICATVHNVLARLPGTVPGRSVMLSVHYDSVPAGPGASDDGMGVAATLEIARILKAGRPSRNDVLFLIDEGEEMGLLGARAFAAEQPWAREVVGAVVNIDSRGSSGASLLFETSDDNRWLVKLAARALRRPNTSSAFYTIYKRLPNDTDLTVFRQFSMPGVNFANVGNVAHYHTPLDDFGHASAATLQHHGENALAMVRALASTDLATPQRGNAVFFDLFGAAIVWWPEPVTLAMSLAAFLLVGAALLVAVGRGMLTARALVWGLAGNLLLVLLPIAACLAAVRIERAVGAFPKQWLAYPAPLLVFLWTLALLGAWSSAALLRHQAGFAGLWAGCWIWWSVAALLLAAATSRVAFAFVLPALAAGLTGVWAIGRAPAVAAAVPALFASFFWLPMAWLLYDVLGNAGAIVIAAAVVLPAMTAAPILVSLSQRAIRAVLWLLFVLAIVGLIAASLVPALSARSPQRMSIAWSEDADAGVASWVVTPEAGALPPSMQTTFGFRKSRISPWLGNAMAFAAPAATAILPGPEVSGLEDRRKEETRRIHFRLRSARAAYLLFVALPPTLSIRSLSIAGKQLPRLAARQLASRGGWQVYSCVAPPEGTDCEIVTSAAGTLELVVGDESLGLPAGGETLLRLRPATAVPSGWGDLSVISRRIRLRSSG